MQYITTVSSKGQIVIPKIIRDQLGLSSSTMVSISLKDKNVIAKPVISSDKIFGSFKIKQPISAQNIKQTYKDAVAKKSGQSH